ncbi:ComF family protein [Alicyclobacillus hesperidum URH17-3-68]|nr:hypothetical protein [Alicyclobacillus hesperidum]EJY54979.1 ComF family protein [Alicyclobacillus hesperidum URH17-3-68]
MMEMKPAYLATVLVQQFGSWVGTPSEELLEDGGTVIDNLLTAGNGVPDDIVDHIHDIPETTWSQAWDIFHEATAGN